MDYKLRSDSLSEFLPAFLNVQKELSSVHKNRSGRFNYADWNAVLKEALPLLLQNNIIVCINRAWSTEANSAIVLTTLYHISDQWISDVSPLYIDESENRDINQKFGSSNTYQKRYGLINLLALSIIDDPLDSDSGKIETNNKSQDIITEKQLSLVRARTIGNQALRDAICKRYKVAKLEELKKNDVNDIIKLIEINTNN